jgi:hypothetical protein
MIISPEQYFYVSDGSVLKSLNDFVLKMKNISSDSFAHHVNAEKNDFANWIREVLKDGKLALSVSKAKSPTDVLSAIQKRLSSIEKMKSKKEDKRSLINEIREAHA